MATGEEEQCELLDFEDEVTRLAKEKWLAETGAPTWQAAADMMASKASEAEKMAEIEEQCETGDDEACEILSVEEEAKLAWLARLGEPSWKAKNAMAAERTR